MKPILLTVLLMPVVLSGCLMEVLTTTAIQGELAARDAQASAQALHYAKDTKAKIEAERAIQVYRAETGKNPASLAALVPNYLASVPLHSDGRPYGYDPATGSLLDEALSGPARIPFTAEDQQNLERIGTAIYRYWESTGYYPNTLDDLDPIYIDRVPTLGSGDAFLYDAQTGAVFPPAAAQPSAGQGNLSALNRGAAGGGAGALGEATTGIAIQRQLGDMNTAGVAGTGSAARGALNGISDSYNLKQNRALDQLDQ